MIDENDKMKFNDDDDDDDDIPSRPLGQYIFTPYKIPSNVIDYGFKHIQSYVVCTSLSIFLLDFNKN